MKALDAEAYDVRIQMPHRPTELLRRLEAKDVTNLHATLARLSAEGAKIDIRAHDSALTFVRGLTGHQLREAARDGFQAAASIQVRPGVYDVWFRHTAPRTSISPEVAMPMSRVVRAAAGAPLTGGGAFGALAGLPSATSQPAPRLASFRAAAYDQSAIHQPYFEKQLRAREEAVAELCLTHDLPSLTDWRADNSRLSTLVADRAWATEAVRRGASPDRVFAALLADTRLTPAEAKARANYALTIVHSAVRAVPNPMRIRSNPLARTLDVAAKILRFGGPAFKVLSVGLRVASNALRR